MTTDTISNPATTSFSALSEQEQRILLTVARILEREQLTLKQVEEAKNNPNYSTAQVAALQQEALNAAAKAQSIMTKHRIDLAKLTLAGQALNQSKRIVDSFRLEHETTAKKRKRTAWKGTLMAVAGELNGCACASSNEGIYVILGRPVAVQATKYLFAFITAQADSLVQIYLEEIKKENNLTRQIMKTAPMRARLLQLREINPIIARDSFLQGYTTALCIRMRAEMRRQQEFAVEPEQTTALVKLMAEELDEARQEMSANNVARKPKRSFKEKKPEPDHFSAGYAQGKNLVITKGVASSEDVQKQLT